MSYLVTLCATALALSLMSLADGANIVAHRPRRVIPFAPGPPADHQGLGNALTPETLAPARKSPTPPPPAAVRTPTTELAVSSTPVAEVAALQAMVAAINAHVVTPPPPVVAVAPPAFDAVAAANAERHHLRRMPKAHARHVKHRKAARHRKAHKHRKHTNHEKKSK